MLNLRPNKIFVQIGTGTGYDEFGVMVKEYNPSMVLLVEPQASYQSKLREWYKNVPNIFVEEVAIVATDDKEITLYHPRGWMDCYYSLVPMQEWGDRQGLCKTTVPAVRFNDLCKKYNITEIELLEIDTEGYDMIILNSIDYDSIDIRNIIYENWGFGKDAYSYLEDYEKCGAEGLAQTKKYLESKGYLIGWHSVENERAIKQI